jgi:phosphatidylglycerophosphate synthase
LTPSALTVLGVLLVFASCVFLLLTHRLVAFGLMVTAASLIDVVDGALARATNQVTLFGAYLDAMCDRYAEAAMVLSVAVVTGYWVLSGVLLAGSLLVSYAKARAAIEVPVSNREWPDLMERAERNVLYVVGLLLGQFVPWRPMGRDLFWWTLAALCVLVHITVLQRMRRAAGLIRERAGVTR